MICYVDLEHQRALEEPAWRIEALAHCMDVARRLEDLAGEACLVQRYERVSLDNLRRWGIRALVIGGNVTAWEHYDRRELTALMDMIRAAPVPILGICGGMQLIGMSAGAAVGPMRPLAQGERPRAGAPADGYFREWGYLPVRLLSDDPLFAGLSMEPAFLQVHYCCLRSVPAGFRRLAATDECPIQAIRRDDRPVYGVQFHPEAYTLSAGDRSSALTRYAYPADVVPGPYPDGSTLLTNFLKGVAGL